MPRDVTRAAELVDSECLGIERQPSLEDVNIRRAQLKLWIIGCAGSCVVGAERMRSNRQGRPSQTRHAIAGRRALREGQPNEILGQAEQIVRKASGGDCNVSDASDLRSALTAQSRARR